MYLQKLLKFSIMSFTLVNILYANNIQKYDDITVVANKVDENIQDIPQSITVIGYEEIEEKGIKTIEDVISEIPNMTIIPDRGMKVSFRGLNASLFTENNPVVIYIDGVPISSKRSYIISLENVERVEVLRGPQSTLYGKDAIGGVINIITKEPTNETTGTIGIEYGSNNYIRSTFNLNTPLIADKLFINLNGEITSDDGWVTNTYNNDSKAVKEKNKNFGTSLYYKATDNLSTRLVLKKERSNNYGFKGYGTINPTSYTLSDFNREKAENHGFEKTTFEKYTINSQGLNIKYNTDSYTFNSTTVHRKSTVDGKYDLDYTTGNYLDNSHMYNTEVSDNYSQEFRISNNQTNGIRWVNGIYLDTQDQKHNPYGANIIYYGTNTGNSNMKSNSKSNTQAIFAQTMIPLTEKLDLTLGARYQRIKKEIDYDYYIDTIRQVGYNDKKAWNTFIPKVALNYKFNDNLSPFISISKGYMPGGFNSAATDLATVKDHTFKPQQSINYEIGIKGIFNDFNFSASIFRMNIEDVHVYRRVGAVEVYTDNADKAHSQGVEFDFQYFLTNNLEISGSAGIIKTKYDSYDVGDYNFSGNKIETTPTHTVNLSISYNHPSGFYARTNIRNQGSMSFYDDVNKDFAREDGYTLVDAKIGYKFSDWNIYVYGKNLTDEEYVNMYESNSTFSMATFGDPKFFGIGVKYTF
ncbi:TonB-dependent receptor [Arcobacter sp.]|uniref:TonB-dependent receptor n=1 Tax=unclassified Arcobacter TaxID=2593671 RepID=UPI003AFFA9F4